MDGVAIITGARGGVGAATCQLLSSKGLDVLGVDRRPPPAEAPSWEYVHADIANGPALERELRGRLGGRPVIALVNNAAVQDCASLEDLDDEAWTASLETNVGAAHQLTRMLAPSLRATRGAIVNVASVHALATTRGMAAYATSKAGLVAYTRVAALELAPEVRVNSVLPGAVSTRMLEDGLSRFATSEDERRQAVARLVERTPLARVGRPEEIAQVISFLLDGEVSSFITGASIIADGGVSARLSSE